MTAATTKNPAGSPVLRRVESAKPPVPKEFEQFSALTANLLRVPKTDLDELRKKKS